MQPKFLYEILTVKNKSKTELSILIWNHFNTLTTSPSFTIMLKISIFRKTNREHTYPLNLKSLVS